MRATFTTPLRLGLLALSVAACGSRSPNAGATLAQTTASASAAFLRQLQNPVDYRVDHHPGAERSTCGANDLQPVNSYDGKLGQTVGFVRLHKFAVGAVADGKQVNSSKYCTGTLVGPDLFITAGHCADATTVGQYVSFNYEWAAGVELLQQDYYRIGAVVETGGSIDYAVFRLEGNPGLKWGWASVRTTEAQANELITVIQHPEGAAKQLEVGHVAGFDGDYLTYGDVDTEPGSSGSGIIDAQGYLIGVHTNGGCDANGGTNSGVRLNAARASTTLARLANASLPFGDGSVVSLSVTSGSSPLSLGANVAGHAVVLTRAGETAALTNWTVVDLGDGSFNLKASDGGRSVFLDGRTGTGSVTLRDAVAADDYGTKWRIVKSDDGKFLLRTVGQVDGPRWLSAGAEAASVSLAERAEGWDVVVR